MSKLYFSEKYYKDIGLY